MKNLGLSILMTLLASIAFADNGIVDSEVINTINIQVQAGNFDEALHTYRSLSINSAGRFVSLDFSHLTPEELPSAKLSVAKLFVHFVPTDSRFCIRENPSLNYTSADCIPELISFARNFSKEFPNSDLQPQAEAITEQCYQYMLAHQMGIVEKSVADYDGLVAHPNPLTQFASVLRGFFAQKKSAAEPGPRVFLTCDGGNGGDQKECPDASVLSLISTVIDRAGYVADNAKGIDRVKVYPILIRFYGLLDELVKAHPELTNQLQMPLKGQDLAQQIANYQALLQQAQSQNLTN